MQRRLAAILAADMVGYSRLIERDEAGTIQRLRSDRQALIDPAIIDHGGQIVRMAGDGALVEFPSVVEAVQCAIDIQRGMPERNVGRTEDQRIIFRIGVNLGDIVVEDDNLHGDGINIAARLENLADPGSILLTEEVARHVDGKVSALVEFVGERAVKNIERSIRVWRVDATAAARSKVRAPVAVPRKRRWGYKLPIAVGLITAIAVLLWFQPWAPRVETAGTERMALQLADKPSVAVLPFDNLSGDPDQDYFSDGISEDIITNLSRLSNLVVIARNSSFSYKGQNVKVQELARDLGVEFVLEGSVRKAGRRVRITAQLVNATNGHHLWAEHYDRELNDIFALQDEITQLIVSSLSVQLVENEERRIKHRATDSFEAYDIFLQAQQHINNFTPESFALARSGFRGAIALDSEFARAYGALAVTLAQEVAIGWSTSPTESLMRALDLANTAVAMDPESPQVLWALGFVHQFRKEYEQAFQALDRAIALAPNYADAYGLLALISNNMGKATDALRYIEKGMTLNPHYSWEYLYNLGRAQYVLGDYESAVKSLELATERNEFSVFPHLYLAAAYLRLGLFDDAEWQVTLLVVTNPEITLSHLDRSIPLGNAEIKAQLLADLRQAGMTD